jgi:hypothetical protein
MALNVTAIRHVILCATRCAAVLIPAPCLRKFAIRLRLKPVAQ